MKDLSFYNENMEFIGMIRGYLSLIWTRRFSSPGEFVLQLDFNFTNIKLIEASTYIEKDNEFMVIENLKDTKKVGGAIVFEVTGRSVSCILDRRVITYIGNATLKNVFTNIITQNFISPTEANRKIANFNIINSVLINNPVINVKYEKSDCLNIISELCNKYKIGFRIELNLVNKGFDLYFSEGIETNVLFSEDYKNILEQEYFYRTKEYKNVCLIADLTVNNSAKGIDRREIAGSINSTETTTVLQQGEMILAKNNIIENFNTVIDSENVQYEYKKDWDLGSIVSNESVRWGIEIEKQILEITEYYQGDDIKITPVFGDLV